MAVISRARAAYDRERAGRAAHRAASPGVFRRMGKALASLLPAKVRTNWLGTSNTRLTADWQAFQQSANDEIRWDLLSLRKRAREQERNNPHVRRFLNLLVKNVVGSKGVVLGKINAQTVRGAPHPATVDIQAAFKKWSKPAYCTINRSLSWIGVQAMAVHTWARDGEAFVRMIPALNPFGFSLQFLDADLLDESLRVAPSATQNEIQMGCELDAYGACLGYHFWDRHPTESWGMPRKRIFIPADQIIHLHRPRRYGAVRSETIFAPVLKSLRDTAAFIESAVINARTGANKMGFITKDPDTPPEDESAPRDMVMEAQAGSIEELEPGENFVEWNPAFPSESFGPFNTALLQYAAAGLDIPAIALTGDLTQTSYASSRVGRLDEQDTYRQLQGWLIETLIQPIYEKWLMNAMLAGALTLPGSDAEKWHDVIWRPRGWQGVDPMKEVMAARLRVAFGFSSNSDECSDNGDDFTAIMEQQKADIATAEKAGVDLAYPSTVILEGANDDNTQAQGSGDGNAAVGGASGRAAPRGLSSGDRTVIALNAGGRR